MDKVRAMEKGRAIDVVYVDFSKLSLIVRLGKKVEASEFGGNLLRWIENVLNDRRQIVGIGGKFSE